MSIRIEAGFGQEYLLSYDDIMSNDGLYIPTDSRFKVIILVNGGQMFLFHTKIGRLTYPPNNHTWHKQTFIPFEGRIIID